MERLNFEMIQTGSTTIPMHRRRFFVSLLVISFMSIYLLFRANNSDDHKLLISLFDQPFCDADGTCHEQPDVASPRTVYSAWNKEQYDLWWKYTKMLQARVQTYAENREAGHEGNTRPLILLGDSITEAWSGTGLGRPKHRAEGVPKVLEDELSKSSGLDPIVLGVSGDQTQHLLYRLQNGHMRAAQLHSNKNNEIVYDPSAIFVVMIGTNNLGSGELPGPTTEGILAVVEYLLKETDDAGCNVILFKVLPRGDGKSILPQLCPPRCKSNEKKVPFSSFLPPIQTVNDNLDNRTKDLNKTYSSRIRLIDCNSPFLNKQYQKDNQKSNEENDEAKYEVKTELIPDLLHPNALGHQILANCIKDSIDQIDGS